MRGAALERAQQRMKQRSKGPTRAELREQRLRAKQAKMRERQRDERYREELREAQRSIGVYGKRNVTAEDFWPMGFGDQSSARMVNSRIDAWWSFRRGLAPVEVRWAQVFLRGGVTPSEASHISGLCCVAGAKMRLSRLTARLAQYAAAQRQRMYRNRDRSPTAWPEWTRCLTATDDDVRLP